MKKMKLLTVCAGLFLLLTRISAENISFESLFSNNKCTLKTSVLAGDDEPKYGKDSVTCVRNLSIYREFFRQKNYNDALEPWRWVFFNCPLSSQNMYLDGVVIFKELFNADKNPEKKEKYVDTLMMIYDQRIKAFGREGFVLGRKGIDLLSMSPKRLEDTYNFLAKSIEMEKNATKADVLTAYFQSAIKLSANEKYGKSIIIDAYIIASDIIDYNLKNNQKDSAFFNPTKANLELLFSPLATCPDLIGIYTKKYEQTPDNKELLIKISTMLSKFNCTEDELYFKATESLHKIEPTANSAYLMGKMLLARKQYTKAAEYLQEAVKLFKEDDNDKKADALLQLAENYYRNLNQLVRARTYALQALEVRPNDGRPLILIGNMYASSAATCGENELEKKVAYWAAVDKFIRAKNVDPSVESVATQLIQTWSQYFPNDETIFFYNLQKGQSYTVGCWINETTTVR